MLEGFDRLDGVRRNAQGVESHSSTTPIAGQGSLSDSTCSFRCNRSILRLNRKCGFPGWPGSHARGWRRAVRSRDAGTLSMPSGLETRFESGPNGHLRVSGSHSHFHGCSGIRGSAGNRGGRRSQRPRTADLELLDLNEEETLVLVGATWARVKTWTSNAEWKLAQLQDRLA